jgi:hypothetical protein
MTEYQIYLAAKQGARDGALLAAADIAELGGKSAKIVDIARCFKVSEPTARARTKHLRQSATGKVPMAAVLRDLAAQKLHKKVDTP